MFHGLQDATFKTVALTRKVISPAAQYPGRSDHIGGMYVERLSKGNRVVIAQYGIIGKIRLLYSGYGGGMLTFRGELISVSDLD